MATDTPEQKDETCPFCGGWHPETQVTFLGAGIKIRPCPNMPKGWLAVGPDTDGHLLVTEVPE